LKLFFFLKKININSCVLKRQFIGRKSIDFASKVIEEMARETKDILAQICDKYCELNLQVD
jgi:hypothetical protein